MLTRLFPFLGWGRSLTAADIRQDMIAGLTVALVLIPQSMAYAQLAGLPVYYGLYASFLPPMIAALFGSSRQLATGPVAVVSLMTSASLAPLATAGSDGYIRYAILLAFMVGLFQFLLGVLRLGIVVNFLSHPVVNGFTNAAAIIIATSQLSKMFGVSVDNAAHHYETIFRVMKAALNFTHIPTLIMGIMAFVIMYLLKKFKPRSPNVLVAVVFITAISWAIGFEHNEVVTIDQLGSDGMRERIIRFNSLVRDRENQADERTTLTNQLNQMDGTHRGLDHLLLQQKIDVCSFKLNNFNTQVAEEREILRSTLLSRREVGERGAVFHPREGESGNESGGDGRNWRLKVGNTELKTEALKLVGGGEVVGVIPKGLPAIAMPKFDVAIALHLLSYAAIISLLGFMEAISIAKAMAAKTGQRLDPNQELIGQGLANILGAMGKSYPTSGSFSRSAVNLQSGATSGLSSVITSITVIIVLLFFTPLLYHLPQSVLAAVIMMAVIGLINVSGFVHSWQAQWYDGLISVITFFATLAFAPHLDRGIMIGVILSLGVFLYKSMRPTMPTLSRLEDNSLRDAITHGLQECRYIDMVRYDSPLFFANASYLEEKISERIRRNSDLRHIIIVSNGINDIDASGQEVLSLLIDNVRSAGIDLSLCGVNESVLSVIRRTHLEEKIGPDHIFSTMEAAICAIHEHAHRETEEDHCPLTTVCRLT